MVHTRRDEASPLQRAIYSKFCGLIRVKFRETSFIPLTWRKGGESRRNSEDG
jgi:hypothetical protein